MFRPKLLLVVILAMVVMGCGYGTNDGPRADGERQAALIEAIGTAAPDDAIDLAEVLDAPGADILSMSFGSKDAAYVGVGAGLQTDTDGVWPGEGGGSIVFISRGDTFVAWFGIPDSVAAMCFGEKVPIDDSSFRVVVEADGRRSLAADGVGCPALLDE